MNANSYLEKYYKYYNSSVLRYDNFNPAGLLLSFEDLMFHDQRAVRLRCRLKDEYLAKQMDIENTWELIKESEKILLLHNFQAKSTKSCTGFVVSGKRRYGPRKMKLIGGIRRREPLARGNHFGGQFVYEGCTVLFLGNSLNALSENFECHCCFC